MHSPKTSESEVPLLEKSAPPMRDVSNEVVIKMIKGLNPSKALGHDELQCRLYFISFGIIEPILVILKIEYRISRR